MNLAMNDVSNRLIWGISSKMWDCGTNCQNVGQMWDKIAKCGKCGNVGRLYSLGNTLSFSNSKNNRSTSKLEKVLIT